MRTLRVVLATVRALFHRNGVTDEIREEMRLHIDMRAEEYERAGLAPAAARRAARRRFGSPALMQDRGYDIRGGGVMETVIQDVRFGARLLLKQRGFSIVSVMTLALGIGLSTALFSVIDSALLRPLPYPDPEQLVSITVSVSKPDGEVLEIAPSMADIRAWKAASAVFSHAGMGRVSGFMPLIVDAGTPDRLIVAEASEDFLETYGVLPLFGRGIQADDTREGSPAVGVLGYDYWRDEFESSPDVVGRVIRIENEPVEIVGVLPPGFYAGTAVWTAKQFSPGFLKMRGSGTPVIGRLRAGVSLEQAARDLDAITPIDTQISKSPSAAHTKLESLYDVETSAYGATVQMLAYAVGLILLIACVNVAGLLLARGATRTLELSIRASIGAGRGRLIRQLITETMILALSGAALGVAFAWLSLDVLVSIVPLTLPANSPPAINLTVLAFSLVLSMLTALAAGLIPAFRLALASTKFNLHLAAGSPRARVPLSRRAGQLLIGSEVALALVLVTGSGLVVRSFVKMLSVDMGFNPSSVLTMEVEPLEPNVVLRNSYYSDLVMLLKSFPEIEEVGAIDQLSLDGGGSFGFPKADSGATLEGPQRTVLPGYFEALDVRPLEGRLLTDTDGAGELGVVLNATSAKRYFPEGATGHTLTSGGNHPVRMRVVGVVPNLRHGGPTGGMQPQLYLLPSNDSQGAMTRALAIIIRARPGASISADRLRAAAESIGPRVLVGSIRPAGNLLREHVATPRQRTLLLSLLGASGLALTLVGVFSTTAYAVARRTREIGIRMAFGAQASDVVRGVVKGAVGPVLLGLAAGFAGAYYAMRLIRSFLFETTPHDPATLVTVVLVVGVSACIAAWIPARRAARVDPMTALRAE